MKKIKRLLAVLLLLVIAAALVVAVYIDSIAKTAVEQGGALALGAPTTLTDADVQVTRGRFEMAGLHIANPHNENFETPHFLTLGAGELEISLLSLMQSTVEVPMLSLDQLEVVVEKKDGKTNLDVIMANIGKLGGKDDGAPKPADESGKRFKVKLVRVTGTRLLLASAPLGSPEKPYLIEVPEIVLHDVGSDTDKGVLIKELTGVLVAAVMRSIVENAGDAIPAAALNTLKGSLDKLGDFGKLSTELIGGVKDLGAGALGEAAKGVGESLEKIDKGVKDVGKEVEKAGKELGNVGKGLENLLGGKKDKKKDE